MKINSRNVTKLPTPPRGPAVKLVKPTPARSLPLAKDGFGAPALQSSRARNVASPGSDHFLAQPALKGGSATPTAQSTNSLASSPTKTPQVPQVALGYLPQKDRTVVADAAAGKKGVDAQANLETVVESTGFKALGAEQQAHVLQSYLAGPASSAKSTQQLTALVDVPAFRGLPTASQQQALDVFNATGLSGRTNLVTLTSREVNGMSALLDTDKDGHTLLTNLHAMATNPLAKDFAANGISRANLLATAMQEAGSPGQVNQDTRNTCTVTSMQYMLNRGNPAEYVRIMQGLTSPGGKVQLRNGDTLTRTADSVAKDSASQRSDTERLFQSAMMDYANGGDKYSNRGDKSSKGVDFSTSADGRRYEGLYQEQEERAMKALLGRNVDVDQGKFFFGFFTNKQEIVDRLAGQNHQPTLVDLDWNVRGHAVVVEKVESGRVYFRNPWGPDSHPNRTPYSNPSRLVEDGSTGVESMTVEDFKKAVREAYIPN